MLGLSGCGEGPDRSRSGYADVAANPEMIVAVVGETRISSLDLARAVNASAQPLLMRGQKPWDGFEESILDRMIESEILYQMGEKAGLEGVDGSVEEKYRSILDRFPDEASLAEALARDGLTMADLRAKIRKEAVVDLFLEREVHLRAAPSEAEIGEYYRNHRERYTDGEGGVKPLDDVREDVVFSLMAERTPGMIEALVIQGKREIPVTKRYGGDAVSGSPVTAGQE